MNGDEKRIYFQNLERRPAEEELQEVMETLRAAGGQIGNTVQAADVDRTMCSLDGIGFRILFTGDEAILCADSKEDADELMKVFK